jgi:hypothetical protein
MGWGGGRGTAPKAGAGCPQLEGGQSCVVGSCNSRHAQRAALANNQNCSNLGLLLGLLTC